MAYSDFTLAGLKKEFGLVLEEKRSLFFGVKEVAPSDLLKAELEFKLPLALKLGNEKARSELIIAPILVDVLRRQQDRLSLFSGIEFSVDPARRLNGICDYLLSRSPSQLVLEAPVLAIVEAKREDILAGLPQCLAEMVAARLFNERAGTPANAVYGAVTTGSEWKFLALSGDVAWVDRDEYYVSELPRILGVLSAIGLNEVPLPPR